jgi:glycolate oxidase FAD binding subunit
MSTNAPPAAEFEAGLRTALGDALAAGDASLAVDGITPRFVATPQAVDRLAAMLAAANDAGAAVIPWGGGRHMALGNAPLRYDLALRTTKLDRVIEYEPADLTVTAEAGITFEALQRRLGEHGQFLPVDAPGKATVGGVLAAGVSGPSRHAYGLPRDWLLGCRIVQADGAVVRAGGRVVKNVAGYDLPKLAVGSLGTLGVIAEATFKVAPLPIAQETALVVCPSIAPATEVVFAADGRGLALRAVAVANARASAALADGFAIEDDGLLAAFWLAGSAAAVERTRQEIAEIVPGNAIQTLTGADSDQFWADHASVSDGMIALRASLPPSAVAGFLDGLDGPALAYPTTGLVVACLGSAQLDRTVDEIAQLRALAEASGGTLIVSRAPVELKRQIDVWGESEALPLMRRLKQEFDPRGTLNPGRFTGGL